MRELQRVRADWFGQEELEITAAIDRRWFLGEGKSQENSKRGLLAGVPKTELEG